MVIFHLEGAHFLKFHNMDHIAFNDIFVDAIKYIPRNTKLDPESPVPSIDESLKKIIGICNKYYVVCSTRAVAVQQVRSLTTQLHENLRAIRRGLLTRLDKSCSRVHSSALRATCPNLCDSERAKKWFFGSERIDVRDLGFFSVYVFFLERMVAGSNTDYDSVFRDYLKLKNASLKARSLLAATVFRMQFRFGKENFAMDEICTFTAS